MYCFYKQKKNVSWIEKVDHNNKGIFSTYWALSIEVISEVTPTPPPPPPAFPLVASSNPVTHRWIFYSKLYVRYTLLYWLKRWRKTSQEEIDRSLNCFNRHEPKKFEDCQVHERSAIEAHFNAFTTLVLKN